MYLLLPTGVYNINGTLLRLVMLFDGTVDYFSHDHSPFCYIALLLMVAALLPSLLLAVYQLSVAHRSLETLRLRRQGLVTFLEAFQGHFRDGTDGGRDLRFLAVLYFTNRFVLILCETLSEMYPSALATSFVLTLSMAFIFFALQPYKKLSHNTIEGSVYLYLSLMTGLRIFSNVPLYYMTKKVLDGRLVLIQVLSFVPAAYFTVIIAIRACCAI